jgi:hypothetical protein
MQKSRIKDPEALTVGQDMAKQASELPADGRKALATKWRDAARGHDKQAKYYEKQVQFTLRDQEHTLADSYEAAANALERVVDNETRS